MRISDVFKEVIGLGDLLHRKQTRALVHHLHPDGSASTPSLSIPQRTLASKLRYLSSEKTFWRP